MNTKLTKIKFYKKYY